MPWLLFCKRTPIMLTFLHLNADAAFQTQQPPVVSNLGLIVIDYLQLMQVTGTTENRATEISEVTPGHELEFDHKPAPREMFERSEGHDDPWLDKST